MRDGLSEFTKYRLDGHKPQRLFLSKATRKVLYLETICNFPLVPPRSPGGTRTAKTPPAHQEEGQLGVEVKLNDYYLELSSAPE